MPGPIDFSMEEVEWKEREEKERKKVDALKKKLPKNKVVQEMSGSEQKEKHKSGEWDLVDKVVWAARDAYFEEGLSYEEAISQLKEALDACVELSNK